MMGMVERVAQAIYEGRNGHGAKPWSKQPASHHAPYLIDAKAAIGGMRSPSGKMLNVGQHFYDKTECGLMDIDPANALLEVWARMIDEALE